MGTLILRVIPILMVLGTLAYTLFAGARLYRSRGHLSLLALGLTFGGLAAGRLLERLIRLPKYLDDWASNGYGSTATVDSAADPYLAVLSAETALMFACASLIALTGALVVRRDALGRTASATAFSKAAPLAVLVLLALLLPIHSKVAVAAAFVLAKAHLV
jgi:hypothetical protein